MESSPRPPSAAVIRSLLERPKTFSFIQAIRLLILAHREQWRDDEDFLRHGLKIFPELSLAHPGTDIVSLTPLAQSDEEKRQRFAMSVTFLSLYGASSPLPTFYTEELIEEAREDQDASRRFLDIFNQALYVLYYRAFNIYKLGQRTLEEQDARIAELQYALLGMGLSGLRESGNVTHADLGAIALCTRHSRSATGLANYIRLLTGLKTVEIEQCVPHRVTVASSQRARLGQMRLGEEVIGTSVLDLAGSFRIHLYQLDKKTLINFLPQSPGQALLKAIVKRYLNTPLTWDLVLHSQEQALPSAHLGQARLGQNTFLSEQQRIPSRTYRFAGNTLLA